MKLVLIVFLGILALNALVVLAVAGILVGDHLKARRQRREEEEGGPDGSRAGAS